MLLESLRRAKKLVGLAGTMFPTNLAGIPKPPKLAATAAALGAYTVGQGHAEVIDAALSTKSAQRLDPAVWAAVEKQLADWAHDYRAPELARQGRANRVANARTCCWSSPWSSKALIARDRGCAKPGRGRRPHHCQAHHIIHWAQGGATDISNMLLLCHTHHKEIHESGWIVRITDGYPEFIPPKWPDSTQRPRRKPPPARNNAVANVSAPARSLLDDIDEQVRHFTVVIAPDPRTSSTDPAIRLR